VFFVDECLGKHVVETLRAASWKVEWFLDHFEAGTVDVDWIPVVSRKEWVILTKDVNIRRKPWEREKVLNSEARVFTLGVGSMTGEEMGRRFLEHRLKIARLLHRQNAPFAASVMQNSVEVRIARPELDETA